MKKILLLLLLAFTLGITCHAQVETVAARTGNLLYYPSMERGKIKKGDRIIVLQQLDNGNFLIVYKERQALVDISFLRVTDGIYRLIRTKEIIAQSDKQIQEYEDSVKNAYRNRLKKEGLQKIADGSLLFPGTIRQKAFLSPIRDIVYKTQDAFQAGEKVNVFYLSEMNKVAGVYTDSLHGYIDLESLVMDDEKERKILLAIPEEDKNKYADAVFEKQQLSVENRDRKQADELINGPLKQMYKEGYPLLMVDCRPAGISVVGRVDIYIEYVNLSPKEIRSVTVSGYFTNQEGKTVSNDISPYNKNITCSDFSTVKAYGKGGRTCSDLSFYNKSVKAFVPTSIRVQYKDGSTATVSAAKCQAMMDKSKQTIAGKQRFFKEHWK